MYESNRIEEVTHCIESLSRMARGSAHFYIPQEEKEEEEEKVISCNGITLHVFT